MFVSRVWSQLSKHGLSQRGGFLVSYRQEQLPILFNSFYSLLESPNKWVPSKVTLQHNPVLNISASHLSGFSSSEKVINQSGDENGTSAENKHTSANAKPSENSKAPERLEETVSSSEPTPSTSEPGKRKRRGVTKRTAFSDSDAEEEQSMDDLVKIVAEKEELLKIKHKEIEEMQDKVLRSYAEMENAMVRTRREAENSKKFAIQSFAKALLDVADNLGRASSVVKDSFSKLDTSKDTVGAIALLKTLLEGVEMTDKQLAEAFKKFGMEKFDPLNEQFDPHMHNAVFQVPDGSKSPGTIAAVLKPGYMLYDRVIRPAEVGVTVSMENNEAD